MNVGAKRWQVVVGSLLALSHLFLALRSKRASSYTQNERLGMYAAALAEHHVEPLTAALTHMCIPESAAQRPCKALSALPHHHHHHTPVLSSWN